MIEGSSDKSRLRKENMRIHLKYKLGVEKQLVCNLYSVDNLNIKWTCETMKCEHCDMGKMRKKNVSKKTLSYVDRSWNVLYGYDLNKKNSSARRARFWA